MTGLLPPFDPEKIRFFPSSPGVYLMKDDQGNVLYIGKAKNLRIRVKQYFSPGRDGRLMIPFLVAKVRHIDTIVVSSEKEALLLENNLIKQHRPRYNALLKDDKTYIALKITTKDRWPTIKIVRYKGEPEPDGLYFGPYPSAYAARQTLDLLNRLFPLRQCSDSELARRTRPCLLYQMKRCSGPCTDQCTEDEYASHLSRTIKFLKGQDKEVIKELYEQVKHHSEALEFEKAGAVLNSIRHLEKTLEVQRVDRPLGIDADALAIYRSGEEVILVRLPFRSGRLIGSDPFTFSRIGENDAELLSSFIFRRYEKQSDIPDELLIPLPLDDRAELEEILSERKKSRVHIRTPQRGEKKALFDMAYKNAEALFHTRNRDEDLRETILLEMQEEFHLSKFPSRIECFDNSHSGGSENVSAMVAFTNGLKDGKRYRTYRLKTSPKSDDYSAMQEVLTRRYTRAKEENDLPDLVIIDGGKGHLGIALKVFEELDVTGVDLIGLAKEDGRHDKGQTAEQVFLVDRKEPIRLKKNSPVLFFLQRIRDEAHRVAVTYHRKRRSKQTIRSALDEIPGIGPVKRKLLLTHFGSVKNIEEADEDALRKVRGLSGTDRQTVHSFFQRIKPDAFD